MQITNQEQYIQALRAHDWMYAWADDASIFNAGQRERDALLHAQQNLDPKFEIWNQYCHPEFVTKGANQ